MLRQPPAFVQAPPRSDDEPTISFRFSVGMSPRHGTVQRTQHQGLDALTMWATQVAWVAAWTSSFFLKRLAMPTIFAMAMVPLATGTPGHPVLATESQAVAASHAGIGGTP